MDGLRTCLLFRPEPVLSGAARVRSEQALGDRRASVFAVSAGTVALHQSGAGYQGPGRPTRLQDKEDTGKPQIDPLRAGTPRAAGAAIRQGIVARKSCQDRNRRFWHSSRPARRARLSDQVHIRPVSIPADRLAALPPRLCGARGCRQTPGKSAPVSYTHLTLPTTIKPWRCRGWGGH